MIGRRPYVIILATVCLLNAAAAAGASEFMMKGPPAVVRDVGSDRQPETSSVKLALLGLIKLYQSRISMVGGPDRCGFRPSCSQYGFQAITEQGPLIGLMMIGDRQTRCNIFKKPGPDYVLLPNGKLFDPLSNNLLFEQ